MKNYLKYIFILFIFTTGNLYSQEDKGYVDVIGSVKLDKMNLPGAQVNVYEGGRKISTVITPTSGRFKLKLDLQKEYTIEISASDLITKKITIKTNVPTDESDIWQYKFSTELFENFPGMDLSALQKPVSKVSFNADTDDFEYDVPYSNIMKKELDAILKQLEIVRKKLYDAAIAKADKLLNDKNYEEAISAYEEAYEIDPFQEYPDEMLYQISRLISKDKSDEISYKNNISKGDGYLAQANYKTAKNYFEKAQNIKPAEAYPKQKIAEINQILAKSDKEEAEAERKDKEFQAAVAKAEQALKQKNYEAAKSAYSQASQINPDDSFSKNKIVEINNLMANNAKAEADAKAKAEAEAKAKADAEKAINDKYQLALKNADALLASKKYEDAKTTYNLALSIKPNETYPKTKLTEIDGTLANIAKAEADAKAKLEADAKAKAAAEKALNDKYAATIKNADALLATKKYSEAKTAYNEALTLKPNETYPKTKTTEIDGILANIAKAEAEAKAKAEAEKALNDKYATAIKNADALLVSKKYDEAKTNYNQALAIKPNETYPKTKISEIDGIIASLSKAEAEAKAKAEAERIQNEKYQTAIKTADGLLTTKKYNDAKNSYNSATSIKPDETYPKTKIKEIDGILADIAKAEADAKAKLEADAKAKAAAEKALNDKYAATIKKADDLLLATKYEEAKNTYNEALTLKPSETYPKTKISQIDATLANIAKSEADAKAKLEAEKALNDKFAAVIKNADALLVSKKYDEAKTNYNQALAIKPNETYPKTKIKEIDGIIASLSKAEAEAKAKAEAERIQNEKYQTAIKTADGLLAAKKYNDAKNSYNSATAIKPDETYPKSKIKEIDGILADIAKAEAEAKAKLEADAKTKAAAEKALNDKYAATIKKADDLLAATKYEDAKAIYNEALTIKANETYPKTKISQIDATLANIAKADAEAKAKLEADAKAKAAAQKALDDKYNNTIKTADGLLASKKYNDAKNAYNAAIAIKAEETYPKTKIKEIDGILADIAKAEADAKEKAEKDAKAKADAEAKALAAAEKAKEEKYQAIIKVADELLASQKYVDAKKSYNEALNVKSNETYPKSKIVEIDGILANIARTEADAKAKAKADAEAKLIAEAKAKEEAIAKQNEEKYTTAISRGDNFMGTKNYKEAERYYKEASALKPSEQYPKNKLTEISNFLTADKNQQAELAEVQKKYDDAIAKADEYFKSNAYVSANASYNLAISIKSTEQYPRDQIEKIKQIQKRIEDANLAKQEAERLQKIKEAQASVKKAELEEVDFNNVEVRTKYLSELAKKYKEGVTVENYEQQGKTIKRIIVNRNNVANEYREVKHSWGGVYWFKNGQSIASSAFYIETKE